MNTNQTSKSSSESSRSLSSALEARFQNLNKEQQRQNELLQSCLEQQRANTKLCTQLLEICQQITRENLELKGKVLRLTSDIRTLTAHLTRRPPGYTSQSRRS